MINEISDLIIYSKDRIINALQQINNNKKGFLIVCDEELLFDVKGVITDGDIRRAMISGLTINDSVKLVLNNNYECVAADANFHEVCEKFKSSKVDFLPILDNENKLFNVLTKKQFHIMLLDNISFDLTYDFTRLDNVILEHEVYNRPWGFYKSTFLTSQAQAKIITVFPNSELSLQEHKKREEHWIIIKGTGTLVLGESYIDVYPGKYVYIPKGCKHQIINNTEENIVFSEVQLGEYFGEDDIIRYSDKYGRK
ncbi:cupin domain-containing protein [Candidatus Thioglobus sp.]|uniref:cupin domain-containing protein n=1 Tax=Candidatus Thioglobus sp. TaxID=2026721 RepID=UPI003D0F8D7A